MSTDPDAALNDALTGVLARSREQLLARVDVLEEAAAALLEGRLDEPLRAQAEREAHRLRGSAGTFGFVDATPLAADLERRFASGPDPAAALATVEQVVALRSALESGAGAGRVTDDPRRHGVILSDDDVWARQLRRSAPDWRFDALDARQPVPADLRAVAGMIIDGIQGLARLEGSSAPPVLVLATPAATPADRLAGAQAGATAVVSRSLDPDQLMRIVRDAAEELTTRRDRLLAVDDDPVILAAVRAILEREGLVVDTVDDPRRFWAALETQAPSLALLDLDMPHVDGLTLCRMVRASPDHAGLPVVVLTSHADRGAVNRAFNAGADDVVAKPIVEAELRARVRNRLERVRLLRRMVELDPLTGLENRASSEGGLVRRIASSARHGLPLSVAVLDVDGLGAVNESHGHDVGDEVLRRLAGLLRRRLRGSDVVARWGGDEFVVGLYGLGPEEAVERLGSILEEFREEVFASAAEPVRATFCAGVALAPDGAAAAPRMLHRLYLDARQAMLAAKREGGDQVRAPRTDLSGTGPGHCDVVLVEDDTVLAELLEQALRTRGYHVTRIADGAEAGRRLTGRRPAVRAGVIVLDVDLPALSGLDLLRLLSGDGVLAHTRVIMLTARAGEAEVLEALRLGAVDHVAKPFSVAVLLERVRHALSP